MSMGCRITNLLQGLSITKFFMPFAFVFITILHLISTAMVKITPCKISYS